MQLAEKQRSIDETLADLHSLVQQSRLEYQGEAIQLFDGNFAIEHTASSVAAIKECHIYEIELANGATKNITDEIEKGELASVIGVRDDTIGALLSKNNNLAVRFADQINGIHNQGFGLGDYAETKGRNFFNIDADFDFAAQNIQVDSAVMDSVDAISVAATPNAPGDNVIVNDQMYFSVIHEETFLL